MQHENSGKEVSDFKIETESYTLAQAGSQLTVSSSQTLTQQCSCRTF